MIDEKELDTWIARLEAEDSSWKNYEKLSVLYTVKNQQSGKQPQRVAMYSSAPAPNVVSGDSDFLQAVASRKADQAWAIVDELMDALKISNARMYDGVMRKMRG